MTRARWRDLEYDLVNFTDSGEWVLRDDAGDVVVFENSERERVQVRCEECGRWTDNIATVPTAPWVAGARWVCADSSCYGTGVT